MPLKYLSLTLSLLLFTATIKAQSAAELGSLRKNLSHSRPDTGRAILLTALGRYYLHKPGEEPKDIDSALNLAGQAMRLSRNLNFANGIAQGMLLEAETYRERGNRDKSLKIYENALAYAQKNNLAKQIAESYLGFAAFYNIEDEMQQKITYTEKAVAWFEKAKALKEQALALQSLGDYYQLTTENTKAITLLEQALSIYQRIHYKEIQGVYDLLGYVYVRTGNDVQALKYGLLAVKTAEQVRDTSMQLCTIYNRLAITYYGLKKNELAYSYYQKALNVALRYNDIPSIQQIQFNQVVLLLRVHKPEKSLTTLQGLIKKYPPNDNMRLTVTSLYLFSTIYMDMKQLPKAKPYVDSLLHYYKDYGQDFGYSSFINQPIIRYYILTSQFTKAYPVLMVNDSVSRLRHSISSISTNEFNWAKADSAMGYNVSALQHYKKYKEASDSLKSIDQRKQLNELQFQFDLDSKDKDIIFLKQQGQLQQNRIDHDGIVRRFIIGGVIILLIIMGLIYGGYYSKQRSNKLLTAKQGEINTQNELLKKLLQEKEWLLKEIHHRVKNNLQIVISLLNTQSAYLDNEDALFAIRNSQHRMHAISLIHQKLYQSANLAAIDMNVYIHELVDYLQECFDADKRVSYYLDVEPLTIDVAQAVPLGLILNEAISNAIKYAFAAGQKGKIGVSLKPYGKYNYELKIADNGVGLPDGFDPEQSSSLGMSLMHGLAIQLEGTFTLTTNQGLNVSIIFKPENITQIKASA